MAREKRRRVVMRPVSPQTTEIQTALTPSPASIGTLADIARAVKKVVRRDVQVDMTPYFEGEQATVLQWRNPSIADIYKVSDDASELLKRNPWWKPQLAVDVATMAVCHVAPNPGGLSAGLFYAALANSENDALWYALVRRMGEEFPHLRENNLTLLGELMDLCLQYLHRHPDELAHLSSEVMLHLREMAERKAAQTIL